VSTLCLSYSLIAAACSGFAAWQVGDINQLLHGRHCISMGLQHCVQQQMRAMPHLQLTLQFYH